MPRFPKRLRSLKQTKPNTVVNNCSDLHIEGEGIHYFMVKRGHLPCHLEIKRSFVVVKENGTSKLDFPKLMFTAKYKLVYATARLNQISKMKE